jgi:chaperonin GroES
MSFKLFHERVAVIADPVSETSKAGLIVTEAGQSIWRYGVVTHVGTGRRSELTGELIPIDLQIGDRVWFHKHSGVPIELQDQEYVILSLQEIHGVLEEEGVEEQG